MNKVIMKITIANIILYSIIFGAFMRKLDNDDIRNFRSHNQHRRVDINLKKEDE